ncbi:MAG: hypothetical protein ABI678_28370 [Kofleriaceae bacterium]
MSSGLPRNVSATLEHHLDSLEKLEIARMLKRGGVVTREALSTELRLDERRVDTALEELARGGWVAESDAVVGVALSQQARDSAGIQATLEAYEDDRIAVINELSALAMGRIRSMAAKTFADAFLLKKKRRGDDD